MLLARMCFFFPEAIRTRSGLARLTQSFPEERFRVDASLLARIIEHLFVVFLKENQKYTTYYRNTRLH